MGALLLSERVQDIIQSQLLRQREMPFSDLTVEEGEFNCSNMLARNLPSFHRQAISPIIATQFIGPICIVKLD